MDTDQKLHEQRRKMIVEENLQYIRNIDPKYKFTDEFKRSITYDRNKHTKKDMCRIDIILTC